MSEEPISIELSSTEPGELVNNKRKGEIEEVWMEPKQFCDFVIKYDTIEIHTHKILLHKVSKYFASIFSLDPEAKEIEIPLQYDMIYSEVVSGDDFKKFFKYVNNLIERAVQPFPHAAILPQVVYLGHYLEIQMVERHFMICFEDHLNNFQDLGILAAFVIWTVYKWDTARLGKLMSRCVNSVPIYYKNIEKYGPLLKHLPRWAEREILLKHGNIELPAAEKEKIRKI